MCILAWGMKYAFVFLKVHCLYCVFFVFVLFASIECINVRDTQKTFENIFYIIYFCDKIGDLIFWHWTIKSIKIGATIWKHKRKSNKMALNFRIYIYLSFLNTRVREIERVRKSDTLALKIHDRKHNWDKNRSFFYRGVLRLLRLFQLPFMYDPLYVCVLMHVYVRIPSS